MGQYQSFPWIIKIAMSIFSMHTHCYGPALLCTVNTTYTDDAVTYSLLCLRLRDIRGINTVLVLFFLFFLSLLLTHQPRRSTSTPLPTNSRCFLCMYLSHGCGHHARCSSWSRGEKNYMCIYIKDSGCLLSSTTERMAKACPQQVQATKTR